MVKSPFVHAKTKEIFEKRTFTRTLQLFDAHADTIRELSAYVNRLLPAGIDMRIEMFEWASVDNVLGAADGEIALGRGTVGAEAEEEGRAVGLLGNAREGAFDAMVRTRADEILQQIQGQAQ